MHISGQQSAAVEEDAVSEDLWRRGGCQTPTQSGKWSTPRNGSKVPQINVKRNDEDTEYNEEEETEERVPVKKPIHIKLEWKRLKNKMGKTPKIQKDLAL